MSLAALHCASRRPFSAAGIASGRLAGMTHRVFVSIRIHR
jgi:hypothetical protein